jgi:hypothetical protein
VAVSAWKLDFPHAQMQMADCGADYDSVRTALMGDYVTLR